VPGSLGLESHPLVFHSAHVPKKKKRKKKKRKTKKKGKKTTLALKPRCRPTSIKKRKEKKKE